MDERCNPAGLDAIIRMVRARLGDWRLPADTTIGVLNVSENVTLRLEPPDGGEPRVLRVHRENYHGVAEIESEIAWIKELRSSNLVQTPRPIPSGSGAEVVRLDDRSDRPRYAVMFAFVQGAEPQPGADLPRWFARLGRTTGLMHRHARGWRRSGAFTRPRWTLDAMVGPGAIFGNWHDDPALSEADRRTIAAAVEHVRNRLRDFGEAPERHGLIHADMRLANLLVHGDDLQVIDFDDCGFGWNLHDFATAVSFFEDDPGVPELSSAWVAGYREVYGLGDADAARIPLFVLCRRIQLTGWLSSHADLAFARELGPGYARGTAAMAARLLLERD